MIIKVVFIILWIIGVSIGLIWPKIYLPLIKWQARALGKVSGFDSKPHPDETLSKRIRIIYSIFLIFGLIVLFLVLTGKAK